MMDFLNSPMNEPTVSVLLDDLKNTDEVIRDRATRELWRIWFEQKGMIGLETLRRAQILLELRDFEKAEEILDKLLIKHPDFAEAWNRRAVLHYIQGRHTDAIKDCERAIGLNPIHFGALHGLALCHMALGNYRAAIQAFQTALNVQPYSLENQRLILECSFSLS
jgi:tetratricopeptide (TPR) repeat protein